MAARGRAWAATDAMIELLSGLLFDYTLRTVALGAAALGIVAGHLVVGAVAGLVERSAGFRPSALVFLPEEAVAYVLVIAAVVGCFLS